MTILIIIGLFIIVSILFLVFFFQKDSLKPVNLDNPELFISDCLKNKMQEEETAIFANNLISPYENTNYFLYKGKKSPYLCRTTEFYKQCIIQNPMILESVRNYLKERMEVHVESCFKRYQSKAKSFKVEVYPGNISLVLSDKIIKLKVERTLIVDKGDFKRKIDSFYADIQSPLYNLLKTASIIANYEYAFCEFNTNNWMKLENTILISKFVSSDSTKVYTLSDRVSKKEIYISIKSCVLPAGI
jgi:hypothetical protein